MTPLRAERAEEAQRLRAQGLFHREIAARMGVSGSYVRELVTDPDGTKVRARKDSYRRPCVDCGTLLSGSDGRGPGAPTRCVRCSGIFNGAQQRVWTREAIIDAIRSFADEFGEAPAAPDWNPWQCRHELHDEARAERFYAREDWPVFTTVVREFGSWNAGIRAAGFAPRIGNGGGGNNDRRRYRAAA